MSRLTLAAFAVVLASVGCAAYSRPPALDGYRVEYVDDVPAHIETYPHTSYRAGYVYLVGDRWCYESRFGWACFKDEPKQLQSYRERWRAKAPPEATTGSEPSRQ